ncbi:MAG: hypothetical protein KDE27_01830, partial [Planctomycetes bacterium]|nr:hypothetical protein [Planctomycetota bacterium]
PGNPGSAERRRRRLLQAAAAVRAAVKRRYAIPPSDADGPIESQVSELVALVKDLLAYVLVDGSRPFTGNVGILASTPTDPSHAINKAWLDLQLFNTVVYAAATFQPLDATLTALAAMIGEADKLPYFTGTETAAKTDFTALARTLLAQSSAEGMRQAIDAGNSEQANVWFEDFYTAGAAANRWASSISGTGAGVNQGWPFIDNSQHAVGAIMLETGTTSSGFASLHTWNNVLLLGSGTSFVYEARVLAETLSSGSDEYRFEVGFGNSWSTSTWPSDAAVFRYDRDAYGDANLRAITRKDGTETATDTGVAMHELASGNDFQRLRIEADDDGNEVRFYVDGALEATHTTNIPNGSSDRMGIGQCALKSAGTTNMRIGIDWTYFRPLRTAAR